MRHSSKFFQSAFPTLQHLSASGKLKITAIIAPPRTGSTSAYMAMAESPSIVSNPCGAVFEPFTLRHGSWEEKLEQGSQHILNRVHLIQQIHGADAKLHILTKDIASFLTPPLLMQWQNLVHNFVFLIDDPYKQIISFLEMLANGRRFGLKTPEGLPLTDENACVIMHSQAQTRRLWPAVSAMLEAKAFKQTGWEYLWEVFEQIQKHCQIHPHKRMAIVESSVLKTMPDSILSLLTQQLADFTFSETMAGPWSKANGKNFNHPNAPQYDPIGSDGVTQSMWVAPVVRAKSFKIPLPIIISPSEFPPALAQHILDKALPVYRMLINHPSTIIFPVPYSRLTL